MGGIGLQASDAELMPPRLRLVLGLSEALRRLAHRAPLLGCVADSVYVRSVRDERAVA